jgi:hypothetical protein
VNNQNQNLENNDFFMEEGSDGLLGANIIKIEQSRNKLNEY